MNNTATPIPTACTVVVSAVGGTCGKPAVAHFTSRSGTCYGECIDHVVNMPGEQHADAQLVQHPPTQTSKPFVLVRDGKIVGYAESKSDSVRKRAARLGAMIVRVQR